MKYTIEIKRSAEREMTRLPDLIHSRVSEKILALEVEPRPSGSRKLEGGEGYRLRVGDYRVLYTIDDQKQRVLIYSIAHRREAYR
ncbi:MAG: type II toxin-antitoxin system RelE/ParE family toxin [candidate division NC10 bacterium]|nr:type II toxin-antitoxin system RelE/ParE family toxin [candidate division NC10 bacterium]